MYIMREEWASSVDEVGSMPAITQCMEKRPQKFPPQCLGTFQRTATARSVSFGKVYGQSSQAIGSRRAPEKRNQ